MPFLPSIAEHGDVAPLGYMAVATRMKTGERFLIGDPCSTHVDALAAAIDGIERWHRMVKARIIRIHVEPILISDFLALMDH